MNSSLDDEKPRDLSRGEIEKLFEVVEKTPEASAGVDPLYDTLAARAAVVGAFRPANITDGLPQGDALSAALERVLDGSAMVREGSERRWVLEPQVRAATLARLGDGAADVLGALKAQPADPLSRALNVLIRHEVPETHKLPTLELRTLVNAAEWCRDSTSITTDGLEVWNQELHRRELLDPLREVVGRQFIGRDDDIKVLRDHVDVVAPTSWFDGWQRWLTRAAQRSTRPVLVVHGVGGCGKSTLMAHFILEHAAVAGERAFPFVYLDFDRSTLDPHNPLSLVLEAARQLQAQFPEAAAKLGSLTDGLSEDGRLGEVERRAANALSAGVSSIGRGAGDRAAASLISLLRSAGLAERPFLLVLDTFEEVQQRDDESVEAVFDWLEAMGDLQSLRVVVSGRAPVEDSNRNVKNRLLGELKKDDAVALLKLHDVPAQWTEQIYKSVGGNPLCLRLAAQLVHEREFEPLLESGDLDGPFLRRLDATQIQGVLYERLLKRTKFDDKRIEKLAHPGLVLRRITPDVIRKVMAPVLDLEVTSESDAEALYRGLRTQISLVREEEGALVHRKDVRVAMLGLQRKKNPAVFKKLNEAAAKYYASNPHALRSDVSLREAAYHALMAERDPFTILAHCTADVLADLSTAADELPRAAATALRVVLGQPIPSIQARKLPDEAWLAYAYQRSKRLVASGDADMALELIRERRVRGRNLLSYAHGLACFQVLEWGEADKALEDATRIESRDIPDLLTNLVDREDLLVRPWVEHGFLNLFSRKRKGVFGARRMTLELFNRGAELAEEYGHQILTIEAGLGKMVVSSSETRDQLREAFYRNLSQVSVDQWRLNMATLRRVVFLGYADDSCARLALRLLGLRLRSTETIQRFLNEFSRDLAIGQGRALADVMRNLYSRRVDLEGVLGLSRDAAYLEREIAAALDRHEVKDLAHRVMPFLRGRFSPWRVPIRTAVLRSFEDAEEIKRFFAKAFPDVYREASLKNVKDSRAWLDAAIDAADDHGVMFNIVSHCEGLAKTRDEWQQVRQLRKALARYVGEALPEDAMMDRPREFSTDGIGVDRWLLPLLRTLDRVMKAIRRLFE